MEWLANHAFNGGGLLLSLLCAGGIPSVPENCKCKNVMKLLHVFMFIHWNVATYTPHYDV